ncbi:hypothetical protein [Stutzerimonas balearica]|uniref:hypothetical protein n=1 Tax=Stutzerimonas balearica TaxID=74829 RepID=UPI0022AF3FC3|nr:hypothetical protein [Stutzerimonas balearica]MCZ4127109.1 hypothetical protein [Stutzerimonas balearica]
MVFQKVTFDRLFPAALSGTGLMTYTSFGFEAAGKCYYSVKVPGRPRIDQGMTVIALLETPNGFREDNGLLGWVDCRDGSIVCDSTLGYAGIFLLSTFWAIVFPFWAHTVIATPENANLAAFFIALLFGCLAFQALYISVKAFIVKRALEIVRDSIKQTTATEKA